MENSILIFKIVAVLHSIAGFILVAIASDEKFRELCSYKNRSWLAGRIHYKLLMLGTWLLIGPGFVIFALPMVPKLAVVISWLSIAFFLSTGLVDLISNRRFPDFCLRCLVSLGVRVIAAIILTITVPESLQN